MASILTQLRIAAEDLSNLKVPWALVGALAVSVYAEPRTTRDIDVAVAVNAIEEQEALVKRLVALGYRNPQLLMHMLPTHRLGFRVEVRGSEEMPLALDLLFSSSGIEAEVVQSASRIEVFPQLFIPVASRGHLIAMKLLSQDESDRLRDRADLQQLLKLAAREDLVVVTEALRLIAERGFNRGRNLNEALSQALLSYAPQLV